jgi:hypothetical protein
VGAIEENQRMMEEYHDKLGKILKVKLALRAKYIGKSR